MLLLQISFGSCIFAILLALTGCGSEGREFTAAELVEELHSNGAPLQLEGPLANDQEHLEVYDLSVSTPNSPDAHGHAGGATLTISEDEEAAVAEFQRCESSLTLTCFRVANGVLQLGDGDPELLAEVEAAVRAMESE